MGKYVQCFLKPGDALAIRQSSQQLGTASVVAAAAMSITAGTAPFTGRFRPEGILSTLDGIPASGTWTLEVTDDEMLDAGLLTAWSITLSTGPEFVCNACTLSPPTGSPLMQRWDPGSKTSMQWESIPGAAFYNVYRGARPDLPNLLTGAVDSCKRLTTGSTATGSAVTETPAPGALLWYLVRAANAAGEGPAGNATAGPRMQNSSGGCP